MMVRQKFITEEGLKKLKEELYFLKHVKRREIAQRIREAQELGDLSENAEYSSAKEEQATTDTRIFEIEDTLRNVTVVSKTDSVGDVVEVGTTVTVKDEDGKKSTYMITGSNEADPSAGKISNESPMGSSFLGKKAGDKVQVKTPKKFIHFEIVSIS